MFTARLCLPLQTGAFDGWMLVQAPTAHESAMISVARAIPISALASLSRPPVRG